MIGQYPPDSIQRDSPVCCSGLVWLPGIEQAGARVTIYSGTGRTSDQQIVSGCCCRTLDKGSFSTEDENGNTIQPLPDFAAAIDAWPTPGNHFSTRWEITTPRCRSSRPKPCQLSIFQKSSFRTGSRPKRGHPCPSSHD
ncbi:MAG: hypothetical protein LWX55_12440 [Deltaproteobacteria bacterium]|nr:hypothetical protein [Deltaproteobacteria bacterium]